MNRTVFSLPARSDYRTARGLDLSRTVEHFTGGAALDELIELLDRRRGVVLSSGTTVPGRYESFDLGFADPPLRLESTGDEFHHRRAERARRGADRVSRRHPERALRRHHRDERRPRSPAISCAATRRSRKISARGAPA